MNIKQILGLIALSFGFFIPYAECNRSIILKNNTGTQIRVVFSIDGQMGTMLLDNQQVKPILFDRIDSLQITQEDSLRSTLGIPAVTSEEYLDQIKEELGKQGNLFIAINPPERTGWFGVVTSYIKPYSLKNVMPLEKTQELLNSSVQEQFPVAIKVLGDNPDAALSVAEVLGVDPKSSLDQIMKEIEERIFLWKYVALQAQTPQEKHFARRVIAILKTLETLATLTLTSPIPKDWNPEKYKPKAFLERNNISNIAQSRENLRLYLFGTDAEIEQKLGPVMETPLIEKGIIRVGETVGKFLEALGIAKRT